MKYIDEKIQENVSESMYIYSGKDITEFIQTQNCVFYHGCLVINIQLEIYSRARNSLSSQAH